MGKWQRAQIGHFPVGKILWKQRLPRELLTSQRWKALVNCEARRELFSNWMLSQLMEGGGNMRPSSCSMIFSRPILSIFLRQSIILRCHRAHLIGRIRARRTFFPFYVRTASSCVKRHFPRWHPVSFICEFGSSGGGNAFKQRGHEMKGGPRALFYRCYKWLSLSTAGQALTHALHTVWNGMFVIFVVGDD